MNGIKHIVNGAMELFLRRLVGRNLCERSLSYFCYRAGLEPLDMAHHAMGIDKWQDDEVSGEAFVVRTILSRLPIESPVCFDVGANTGHYATLLRSILPAGQIYCFEPNPGAFAALADKFRQTDTRLFNLGLSNSSGSGCIWIENGLTASEHGSLHAAVISELHHAAAAESVDVQLSTIDAFCRDETIEQIDFLKIDTEGHELAVLQGAADMLLRQRIGLIQFEFNEMNVVSRSFLRDFYSLLPGYTFYRIDSRRLVPMGAYHARHEIFRFQNLLAVSRSHENAGLIVNA